MAIVSGLPRPLKTGGVGVAASAELAQELTDHVAWEVGPIACPEAVEIVSALPKTRLGKIMRRVLKARAPGHPGGTPAPWRSEERRP